MAEHRLCECLFHTDDGRPWRLHKMQFFKPIYNNTSNRLLLRTSRQSTKTTTIRNKLTTRSLLRPNNAALYVAPTGNQAKDFSKKKLDTVFSHNEALEQYAKSGGGDWNVFFKQFMLPGGTSTIDLKSTGGHRGAESVRGGTYNDIFKDEYQSLLEEHLPVINECAATFQGPEAPFQAYFCNTGTPLSYQNPIEKEWSRSKGYEWWINCPHCRKWMEPIGMQNLDKTRDYLFCTHCGRNVYRPQGTPKKFDGGEHVWDIPRVPPKGKWIATNPKGKFPGYRIVRMMVPWAMWRSEDGTGILDRMETWPERQFQNEVMGLPFDGGQQPFPESVLRKCCTSPDRLPRTEAEELAIAKKYRQYPKFAGLDWAQNSNEDMPAYTCYGIWALVNGKLRLIYAHRFVGRGSSDPDHIMSHIGTRINRFGMNLMLCDYGMGYWLDRQLMKKFPGKVQISHYSGSTSGKSRYDANHQKWIIPKTPSMQNLETYVRKEQMEFPAWEDAEEYARDLMRVTIEISEANRTILYRRNGTDDFAHVANYAHLAWRIWRRGDMQSQMQGTGSDLGPVGVLSFACFSWRQIRCNYFEIPRTIPVMPRYATRFAG